MAQATENVQRSTDEWNEYFGTGRDAFTQECCFSKEAIDNAYEAGKQAGVIVLHLNTAGQNNVIAQSHGFNTLLKSVFLMNPVFRKNVIGYYRSLGFTWVDIICLKRDHWKIFLWADERPVQG